MYNSVLQWLESHENTGACTSHELGVQQPPPASPLGSQWERKIRGTGHRNDAFLESSAVYHAVALISQIYHRIPAMGRQALINAAIITAP